MNLEGFERALGEVRSAARSAVLFANRLRFHLFFKNRPAEGEYCNSKLIRLFKQPAPDRAPRPYLAIIRCGVSHCLIDDRSERKFDIALNLYARPGQRLLDGCEYAYAGGANKFKGAYQFIDGELLRKYRGFIFLDDDLEMTYSQLSGFVEYCSDHAFAFAQPSLTPDSPSSHRDLVNAASTGSRPVGMVEVMCPYFSSGALSAALNTFDLSYSTWGLDHIWPKIPGFEPVVVDEFMIRHTRPVGGAGNLFYRYLRSIGVSPQREADKLRKMSDRKVRAIALTHFRNHYIISLPSCTVVTKQEGIE